MSQHINAQMLSASHTFVPLTGLSPFRQFFVFKKEKIIMILLVLEIFGGPKLKVLSEEINKLHDHKNFLTFYKEYV